MYCFIPAWYNEERTWYDNSYAWYRKPLGMTFDDVLNHMKMFQESGQETMAIVLNYMPNLRLFLHCYDLMASKVISVFDSIQSIHQTHETILDYKDLNWPKDAEFITSPFLILVRQSGKIIAQIEFGEEGYLLWIDYFNENGDQSRRYVFDDRGFLSSILVFEDGQAHHQDYLNLSGQWQIREYLLENDHHVEVNPDASRTFKQERYESIQDLIEEVLKEEKNNQLKLTDTIFLSAHQSHNDLVLDNFIGYSTIISFFQERYPLIEADKEELAELCEDANLILVDRQSHLDLLQEVHDNVALVSLFDARLSLGKSQRLKEQKVYLLLDTSIERLEEYLLPYFEAMENNETIVLNLVAYEQDHWARKVFEANLVNVLSHQNKDYLRLPEDNESEIENAMLEDEEHDETYVKPRITLDFLQTELDVMKALEHSRLIVDLSDNPDLYTQIAGISAGIPQINAVPTEFVVHEKNGLILSEELGLQEALDYYLQGLSNWNQALVHAVERINDYTSGSIVEKIISLKSRKKK